MSEAALRPSSQIDSRHLSCPGPDVPCLRLRHGDREHGLDLLTAQLKGIADELDPWSEMPQDDLALLLGQLPRQRWRESAKAFADDPQSLTPASLTLGLRAVED